jgi:hypothetical protein
MRWILFIVTLPWTLLASWPWVLVLRLFAARDLRLEELGVLTAVWRSWVVKPRTWLGARTRPDGEVLLDEDGRVVYRNLWRWSTTIGRGIIYQPGARRARPEEPLTATEDHELVHVRQVEDRMMLSFVVGLAVLLAVGLAGGGWPLATVLGGVLWASGGSWQAPNFLSAGIRHGFNLEGVYRQAEHERSARAQTSRWCSGKSWLGEERRKAGAR